MRSCTLTLMLHLNRYNAMRKLVVLLGMIVPILGGCAKPLPTSFSGQCLIQPVAAQQGMMLANVHCEKAE